MLRKHLSVEWTDECPFQSWVNGCIRSIRKADRKPREVATACSHSCEYERGKGFENPGIDSCSCCWKRRLFVYLFIYYSLFSDIFKIFFFIIFFYLKVKRERCFIPWFTLQWPQEPEMSKAEICNLELHLGLPPEWQRPEHLNHHLLFPRICTSGYWVGSREAGTQIRHILIGYTDDQAVSPSLPKMSLLPLVNPHSHALS